MDMQRELQTTYISSFLQYLTLYVILCKMLLRIFAIIILSAKLIWQQLPLQYRRCCLHFNNYGVDVSFRAVLVSVY